MSRPDWQLRGVPAEQAEAYRANGWWTGTSLGDMVAAGLSSSGNLGLRVHSAVRPWAGTLHDVDRAARSLATTLRGARSWSRRRRRLPVAELGRRRHHLLGHRLPRRRHRARGALLRTQGGRVHPRRHRAPGRRHRGHLRAQRLPEHLPPAPRRPGRHPLVGGPDPDRSATGAGRHDRVPARRRSPGEARTRRPGRTGPDRFHVGHDAAPQGRGALASHDRLRVPPARSRGARRAPRRRSPARPSGTSWAC